MSHDSRRDGVPPAPWWTHCAHKVYVRQVTKLTYRWQHKYETTTTLCRKISGPAASNTFNSVRSSWISMKYHTLNYLNITYGHTHYDVLTLPRVFSVASL